MLLTLPGSLFVALVLIRSRRLILRGTRGRLIFGLLCPLHRFGGGLFILVGGYHLAGRWADHVANHLVGAFALGQSIDGQGGQQYGHQGADHRDNDDVAPALIQLLLTGCCNGGRMGSWSIA